MCIRGALQKPAAVVGDTYLATGRVRVEPWDPRGDTSVGGQGALLHRSAGPDPLPPTLPSRRETVLSSREEDRTEPKPYKTYDNKKSPNLKNK